MNFAISNHDFDEMKERVIVRRELEDCRRRHREFILVEEKDLHEDNVRPCYRKVPSTRKYDHHEHSFQKISGGTKKVLPRAKVQSSAKLAQLQKLFESKLPKKVVVKIL